MMVVLIIDLNKFLELDPAIAIAIAVIIWVCRIETGIRWVHPVSIGT